MERTRLIVGFLVFAIVATGCAASATWPRVVPIADVRAPAVRRGEWIASDEEALASIAEVMSRDLRLPEPQASLVFHRDRDAFRLALEADGYDPAFARQTAQTLAAVSGFRRVLINDAALQELPWPHRIALLAHELTHTIQYEWGGGVRGTSEQWLREGFADWVEMETLVALGFTTRERARATVVRRLRDDGVARTPPSLAQMVTFPDWVTLVQRFGEEATYGYAMIAAQLVLERHGLTRTIAYFELFAGSSDRVANFRWAFGEELAEFESALRVHLAELLR